MARRPNPNCIKLHRSYTVREAAQALEVHENTIRNYLREGLDPVEWRKPILILGAELRRFLEERRANSRQSCPTGYIYCIRCKEPKRPAGDIADYIPLTETSGNLRAICPDCYLLMYRRVALARIDAVLPNIAVALQQAPLRIGASEMPCLICDMKGVANNDQMPS